MDSSLFFFTSYLGIFPLIHFLVSFSLPPSQIPLPFPTAICMAEHTPAMPRELRYDEYLDESTKKDVQHVMMHVVQACKENGKVGYFHLLMDPSSFGRSVENMCHFTYLIKDGLVGIKIGEDGLPYIYLHKQYNTFHQFHEFHPL